MSIARRGWLSLAAVAAPLWGAGCGGVISEDAFGAERAAASAASAAPVRPRPRPDAGPPPRPARPAGADAGGVSAPAEPDAGAPPAPRMYCDAVELVLKASCGNGSCHSNRGATIGDFAVGAEEAARYVSRASVRNADCGLIIDPRNPADSLILTKVTGTYRDDLNCGAQMPVGSFEITEEQIECLADWVEQFGD